MNRTTLFFMGLILILFSILIISQEDELNVDRSKGLPGELNKISDTDYVNFLSTLETANCEIPINESIVNKIHIKKYGKNFEINCERGPLYEDLLNNHPGKFEKCNEEIAKKIDDALRTNTSYYLPNGELYVKDWDLQCTVPMSELIPEDLTYYILFVIGCEYPKEKSEKDPLWWRKCFADEIKKEDRYKLGFFVLNNKTKEIYS